MNNRATAAVVIAFMFVSLAPLCVYGAQLASRWTSTATDGSGLGQGDPTTITWSFIPDGTTIRGAVGETTSGSDLISFLDANLGSGGGADFTLRPWFSIFNNSFGRMAEVSGLTTVYEPNDSGNAGGGRIDGNSPSGVLGVRGDVRVGGHSIDGQSGSNTLAYNYYPNTGDMVIDTDNVSFYTNSVNNYRGFRNVLMHEHGHGLGLFHMESSSGAFLMEPFINTSFDGSQFDDILGLQRHYGDVNEKTNGGAGNDTYTNATSLGAIPVGQSVILGEDATDMVVAATDVDFISIDDNLDADFFSFDVSTASLVDLVLTPLGPTYMQGPQGGSQSSFDSSALSDLTLQLFDTDGTTSLGLANLTGLGLSELLTDIELDQADTYFAKVSGAHNDVQMYQLDLFVTPELLGNVNLDDIVDLQDFAILKANFGTGTTGLTLGAHWAQGDLNIDGVVDSQDFTILKAHFGETASMTAASMGAVPEPATLVLLIIGGLALLSRRK